MKMKIINALVERKGCSTDGRIGFSHSYTNLGSEMLKVTTLGVRRQTSAAHKKTSSSAILSSPFIHDHNGCLMSGINTASVGIFRLLFLPRTSINRQKNSCNKLLIKLSTLSTLPRRLSKKNLLLLRALVTFKLALEDSGSKSRWE